MSLWPQYLSLAWILYSTGFGMTKNVRQSDVFGVFFHIAIGAIAVYVLYAGGFWSPLGWAP